MEDRKKYPIIILIEDVVCWLKSTLSFDFSCERNTKTSTDETQLETNEKALSLVDTKIEDITDENFKAVLYHHLYLVKNENSKDSKEFITAIIDKMKLELEWLLKSRYDEELMSTLNSLEKLIYKDTSDVVQVVLNSHLYEIEDVKCSLKNLIQSNEHQIDMKVFLLDKFLHDLTCNENIEIINDVFNILKESNENSREEYWKLYLLFIYMNQRSQYLSEENLSHIARCEDKNFIQYTKENFPWFKEWFSLDAKTLVMLATLIAMKRSSNSENKERSVLFSDLAIAYRLLGVDTNTQFEKRVEVFALLNILKQFKCENEYTWEELCGQDFSFEGINRIENITSIEIAELPLSKEVEYFVSKLLEYKGHKLFSFDISSSDTTQFDYGFLVKLLKKFKNHDLTLGFEDKILSLKYKNNKNDFLLKGLSDEKKNLLVLMDILVGVYNNTNNFDKSEALIRFILNATSDTIDSIDKVQFYIFPVYKYVWVLRKLKKDKEIEAFKVKHFSQMSKLYQEFGASLWSKFRQYDAQFKEDTEEHMKEKHEIFKELCMIEYQYNDVLSGKYQLLFVLAKREAIKAKASEITMAHVVLSTQYLNLSVDAKEILDEHEFNEERQKIELVKEEVRESLKQEKLGYSNEVKSLLTALKEKADEVYFELYIDGEKSRFENQVKKIKQDKKEMKSRLVGGDLLLLTKAFAMDEKSETISLSHLHRAFGAVQIDNKVLLKSIPKDIDIESGVDVLEMILKAKEAPKVPFDVKLKQSELFAEVRNLKEETIASLRV